MIRRFLLSLAMLLCISCSSVYAIESGQEWFIRSIASDFTPLFERCESGLCRLYGFEDIVSWEDARDPQVVYWSVAVVILPNNTDQYIAKIYVYRSQMGKRPRVMEVSSPFVWSR